MRKVRKVVGTCFAIWGGIRTVVDLLSSFEATRDYARSAYLVILTAPASRSLTVAVIVLGLALLLYEPITRLWSNISPPSEPYTESEKRLPTENPNQRAALKLRPKIVPVRWGKKLDRTGLIVRNDGESAFSISIAGPLSIGDGTLDFTERPYSGLTQSQGELLIEARVRLGHGGLSGGGALRELMVQAKIDSIPLVIRYRDFEGEQYTTHCEVVKVIWDDGLTVRLI